MFYFLNKVVGSQVFIKLVHIASECLKYVIVFKRGKWEICRMWEEFKERACWRRAWIDIGMNIYSHALGLRNLISFPLSLSSPSAVFLVHITVFSIAFCLFFLTRFISQNSFFIDLSGLYKPKSDHVHLSTCKS